MKRTAIVLAAGKGVRMRSDLPKVAHMLAGKPLIVRVLETLQTLGLDDIFVVVGYKADIVRSECEGLNVKFVEQKEQLGTGHAVVQVKPFIDDGITMVLNGDVPMIKAETLKDLINFHVANASSATVLTASLDNPFGYGRIIRANDGIISRIVEQKDATPEELQIKEINTGTYCFNTDDLFSALNDVSPNNVQKEYYLTDVIGILNKEQKRVFAHKAKDARETLGVNTLEDLAKLEAILTDAI